MKYLDTIYVCGILSLCACNGDSEPEDTIVDNQGTLCLSANGNDIRVQAVIDSCLTVTCDVIETASCSISVTGNRIDVSNHLEYGRKRGFSCSDGCYRATAECGTISIPPGAYQVVLGSSEGDVEAPLSMSTRVFGAMYDCEFETSD
jgi:hypothetical protein